MAKWSFLSHSFAGDNWASGAFNGVGAPPFAGIICVHDETFNSADVTAETFTSANVTAETFVSADVTDETFVCME